MDLPAIEWVLEDAKEEAGCESGFVSCDNNWCCDVNDFIVPERRECEQAEKPKIDSESSIDLLSFLLVMNVYTKAEVGTHWLNVFSLRTGLGIRKLFYRFLPKTPPIYIFNITITE